MDRAGDNDELFAALVEHGDRFVVRLTHDRRVAPDGTPDPPDKLSQALPHTDHLLERQVVLAPRKGDRHPRSVQWHPPRAGRMATLRFAAQRVVLQRPGDVPRRSPWPRTLTAHVVYGWEVAPPPGEPAVAWRLITTEPIDTVEPVERIVDWYRTRWLIEEFFKALKTGCAYETRQLESLDTLLVALTPRQLHVLRAAVRCAAAAHADAATGLARGRPTRWPSAPERRARLARTHARDAEAA